MVYYPRWPLRSGIYAAVCVIVFMGLHMGYHVSLMWAGIISIALFIFFVLSTEANWGIDITNNNPPSDGPNTTPPPALTLEDIPRSPAPVAPAAPVATSIPIEVEN